MAYGQDPDSLAPWRVPAAVHAEPLGDVPPLIAVLIEELVDVIAAAAHHVHLAHLAAGIPVDSAQRFLDDTAKLSASTVRAVRVGRRADDASVDLGDPAVTDAVIGALAELSGTRTCVLPHADWATLLSAAMRELRRKLYLALSE